MTNWPRLRASEWILLGFFAYIAFVSHWFPNRPNLHHQPLFLLAVVGAGLYVLARLERGSLARPICIVRDFVPIFVTLLAFREMEYFLPTRFDHALENSWILWDRKLLDSWHLRAAIERFGPLAPSFLEICYLLVYGLPFYCVGVLYVQRQRPKVDRFFVVYLTGTLIAYGLFPFFPSQPPRLVFPSFDDPSILTFFRRVNLGILQRATIHVGVFPSAHVSSAFSAAWAMFLLLPRKKVFGWTQLAYALCVALSTIYGRYHYTADVVAGFAVSSIAGSVAFLFHLARRHAGNSSVSPARQLR